MSRPVSPTLPDDGLLVGWSLEGVPRREIFGFLTDQSLQKPADFLEPVLQTGEGHLLTVAPTGSGKGVGAIIPALLRYPGPVVVVDPKGENYAVTARRREEMGQKIYVVDPFQVTNASQLHRATFNPLDILNPENESFIEDIEMIANILGSEELATSRERFWPYMGYQLIGFLIYYQLKTLPQSKWTLAETRRLVGLGTEGLTQLGEKIRSGSDEELKAQAALTVNAATTTFAGYWSHAHSMMGFLKGSMLEKNMSKSSFSLQDIVEGKPISLYLVLPPEKLRSHARLLSLWFSVLLAALSARTVRPANPTLMILDEAAQMGHLPQVETAITLLRGYGVKVWSFWQDMAQLKTHYPQSWETIINNCSVQQYFGQATALAAESVSRVTGFGTPQEIRGLDQSEMLLSISGDEPVLVQKPNYLRDKPFEGLYDTNPFYQTGDADRVGQSRRVFHRRDVNRRSVVPGRRARKQTKSVRTAPPLPSFLRPEGRPVLQRVQQSSIAPEHWSRLDPEDVAAVLQRIEKQYWMPYFADGTAVQMRLWRPGFYSGLTHYEIVLDWMGKTKFGYCVEDEEGFTALTGQPQEIYRINGRQSLHLGSADIINYLAFFCANWVTPNGRLFLVDDIDDVVLSREVDSDYRAAISEIIDTPHIENVAGTDPDGGQVYSVNACILRGDEIGRADFDIYSGGVVEMTSFFTAFCDVPTVATDKMKDARLIWRRRED